MIAKQNETPQGPVPLPVSKLCTFLPLSVATESMNYRKKADEGLSA